VAAPERAGSLSQAARAAALPVLALLGAVLPLAFLPQIGDYLFYLRAADLLPTYATAWLFLAALAVPIWLLLTLGLLALRGLAGDSVRWPHEALRLALRAIAAALLLAAALYCLLVWLQTFGLFGSLGLRGAVLWVTLLVGAGLGLTRSADRLMHQAVPLLVALTVLGALATLTLPLYRWHPAPRRAGSAAATRGASRRPNILLLSFDALSAEHMSLYGAARPTTPMLSRFAAQATTFDQMYANGNYTTPAVSSMLTGTRPWTNRAMQLQAWPINTTRADSLPAVLHREGYRTGYVSTNSAAGATRLGFGQYFDFASRDRIKDLDLCTDQLSASFRYACPVAAMPLFAALISMANQLHGRPGPAHYDPQLAIDPAIAWLQHLQTIGSDRPVFLWVHLFPPHSPYVTPAPWIGEFDPSPGDRNIAATEPHWGYTLRELSDSQVHLLDARYDESVRYADHYGGLFLQRALELLGPNTAVVVTADHGESFRHGYGAHTGPGLYNELIRVPLIIKLPHQAQPMRSDAVIEQIDLAPTLAQLAGAPIPASWEGHSLLGAWSQPDPMPSTPVFSMNFEQSARFGRLPTGSVAVIDGHWKLVHYFGHLHYPMMPVLHDTLYGLSTDPMETTDLAASHPAEATRLRALIDMELARHARPVSDHGP
jgi:arylsulfatase A-like enzyme